MVLSQYLSDIPIENGDCNLVYLLDADRITANKEMVLSFDQSKIILFGPTKMCSDNDHKPYSTLFDATVQLK